MTLPDAAALRAQVPTHQTLAFLRFHNPWTDSGGGYPASLKSILSLSGYEAARQAVSTFRGYHPTPLIALQGLAQLLDIRALLYKDESTRFGAGTLKAVGGVYALYRLLAARVCPLSPMANISFDTLCSASYRELRQNLMVACASTGNHGRAVARAAQLFGCPCTVYVPRGTSRERIAALMYFGANVVQTSGNYDEAVHQVREDAKTYGWEVLADTSYPGSGESPRDVMHGYQIVMGEILLQLPTTEIPTHIFVQAGVGGIAAALCSHLWERLGSCRPRFVVVESTQADCLRRSAQAGHLVKVIGELKTTMRGLAAGEASLLAWDILRLGAHDFVAIDDEASFAAMRYLACGIDGDPPIVTGESGAAGLGALLAAASCAERREALQLAADSRVLLIGTEGVPDPETYKHIVGTPPAEVQKRRQAGSIG